MRWTTRAGAFLAIGVVMLAAPTVPVAANTRPQNAAGSQTISANSPSSSTTPTRDISLNKAKAIVRAKGYEPYVHGRASAWGKYTLRVLVGVMEPGDSYTNHAFFFVHNKYLGTDTVQPSARMQVVKQSKDAVTVKYTLYRPGDALADPTGGSANVRYKWTGAKLRPLDPIPTDDWSAPLSRR